MLQSSLRLRYNASMTTDQTELLRCPCCGEMFTLAEAKAAVEVPAGAAREQAEAGRGDALVDQVPIRLVFDGGSIGNPGRGYGSYQLTVRDKSEPPKRLDFGDGYTNNEAEYDTLIAALEAIIRRAKDPRRVQLDIRGDSQLIIKQITGAWKVKEPRMQERVRRVHALLNQLGSWRATWHDRAKSVEALGH
jgi:ribonuclease HI